jgi:WD40 repeat protein
MPPGAVARYGSARLRHGNAPTDLAFTADSRHLISQGNDDSLRVWDPATGREVARYPEAATFATIAADGSVVFVEGNRLRSWTPATGKTRDLTGEDLPPGPEGVSGIAIHPNSLSAAVASPGRVRLFDLRTGNRTGELKTLGEQAAIQLAFSPDGRWLAGARSKGGVWLWDLRARKRVRTYPADGADLPGFAFSPDGTRLVIAADAVRVYPVDSEEPEERFAPFENPVLHPRFAPDGKSILAATPEGSVVRLDAATGQVKETYEPPVADLRPPVAVSPSGTHAAAIDNDGAIRVWDLKTGKGPAVEPFPPLGDVWVSPDGLTAQALGGDNKIYTFGLADGRHQSTVELPVDEGTSVFWDARRKRVAAVTGGEVVEVVVIDTDTAKPIAKLPYEHKGQPFVAFDPTDRNRVAIFPPGAAAVVALPSGRTVRTFALGTGPEDLSHGDFSPDGRLLAVTTRPLSVWEMATGKKRFELTAVGDPRDVLFSPDGRLLAAWDGSETVCLFDLRTGALAHKLVPSNAEVGLSVAAFGPGGKLFAAGGRDGTVSVWDVGTGELLKVFAGHDNMVRGVAFTPEGTRLVSASADGTAIVWDLAAKVRTTDATAVAGADEAMWLLGAADPAAAQRGAEYLYRRPAEAVKLFADKIPVPPVVARERIAKLIEDLDSPDFAKRQTAARELEAVGGQARAALRAAADKSPSAEVRKAAGHILGRIDAGPSQDDLRVIRAVEVAERIGTADARKLLETWAAGQTGHRLTAEAAAALARLKASTPESKPPTGASP